MSIETNYFKDKEVYEPVSGYNFYNTGYPLVNKQDAINNNLLFIDGQFCSRRPYLTNKKLNEILDESIKLRGIPIWYSSTKLDAADAFVEECWIPRFIVELFLIADLFDITDEKVINGILYEYASRPFYYHALDLESLKEEIGNLLHEFQQTDEELSV